MDVMARRRMLMQKPGGLLPREYQQVEYIESDGYAYIDTGLYGTHNTSVFYDFQFTKIADVNFFGARINSYNSSIIFLLRGGTWFASSFDGSGNQDIYHMVDNRRVQYVADLDRHTFLHDKNVRYFDGVYDSTIGSGEFTTPKTMFLFRSSHTSLTQREAEMKLYSCHIKEDGTDVRNFVPCYRKTDNEVGMYDTVNGVFYTNANGTGSFIKGQNV